jgi:peptide/nickel transport system permease protein
MAESLLRSPAGWLSLVALALVASCAVIAPLAFGKSASALNVTGANRGPSIHHLCGTDALGRDVFDRTLVASRLSLQLAAEATALAG